MCLLTSISWHDVCSLFVAVLLLTVNLLRNCLLFQGHESRLRVTSVSHSRRFHAHLSWAIYWWKYVRLQHGRWRYAPLQLVATGPSSGWPILLHIKHVEKRCRLLLLFFLPSTDFCHGWLPGRFPAWGPRSVQVQFRCIQQLVPE